MNTVQPSIDSPSSSLADWLQDAIALVQRVNERLRPAPSARSSSIVGRLVLTDDRCRALAALNDATDSP